MALQLHRRTRAFGLAVALGAALFIPGSVLAATGGGGGGGPSSATVTIRSVKVIAKVIAEVQVRIICDPIPTIDPNTGEPTTSTVGFIENSWVNVLQAQGRAVASGTGSFYGQLTCDGLTANTFTVDIAAANLPWKNGSAVVNAGVYAVDEFFVGSTAGNSGNVVVKLTTH